MFVSQFIADAPLPQPRPTRDSFGLGPTEDKEQMGRLASLKATLRGLWSLPRSHSVTPRMRSYPR